MERFWLKVEKTEDCWLWTAGRNPRGYGLFSFGHEQLAHRVAFLLDGGEIPEGMVLHHRCGEPSCVRPDHLEVIAPGEHAREHKTALGGTHCKRGHAFTRENTYVRRNGTRWCRTCANARRRRRRREMRP